MNKEKEIKIRDKKITIRAPKVRDIRAVKQYKDLEDKEIHLLANLTGISVAELDDMYLEDYQKLSGELASFLSQAGQNA